MIRRILIALALTSALTSCYNQKMQELQSAELKGNAYQISLAEKYLELAEKEAEAYDWASSSYFTDKGLRAAYGQEVDVATPAEWGIDAPEAEEARTRLLAMLTPAFIQRQPTEAAALHTNYECWLEELDEGWDQEAIGLCRDRFYAMLKGGLPVTRDYVLSTSHILYFPWSSSHADAEGQEELNNIIAQLLSIDSFEIVLNGHADRSGEEDDNMELSAERSEYIMAQMVRAGIPANRIRYFAFGESTPAVDTPDGVKEHANRRVEIFIE